MRALLFILFLAPALFFGQNEKKATFLKDQNLIEVVYYHDNGIVAQKGTFNLDGKLHGQWESFSEQGDKICKGLYENGRKNGKWFFWDKDLLREVDYNYNAIAAVHEWKEATKVVLQK
ncbi:toxin-antitoxin system YwqK family antitoxin [Robiginitalea sp. IMCC43444]|uniref:toxin-antitoxin system YwqK family antitoxin n=1 Tax=Robiginitalea sp. IMCC43444 TaxID=3459121 RepID=UPI004041470F